MAFNLAPYFQADLDAVDVSLVHERQNGMHSKKTKNRKKKEYADDTGILFQLCLLLYLIHANLC